MPGRKRIGPAPSPYQSNNKIEFLLADQELLYLTWILARNSSLPQTIPSWTGLNIILRRDVPVSKSLIGYLDCLDAPATYNSTIHHLLCRSLITKEKLGLSAMVRAYHQAIFAKAVKWVHPFSTSAKFSEKLAFLTTLYAHVRVRIRR